ncbi:hypothetical protein HMPREF3213_00950 [Heyndrickxia coagulans]|uniref:Uncharacterized protein n=1 Tax=Heyndrickxia coagulans TaxID=1398 RepID=A0A133KX51_HEYCO|nr:hypothetical protein HMPREF3213_00950 [Heyndrickxia coagulans]
MGHTSFLQSRCLKPSPVSAILQVGMVLFQKRKTSFFLLFILT